MVKDRLFALFFGCTIIATFTVGFTAGKILHGIQLYKVAQVNRVVKVDSMNMTIVAKNP